MKDQDLKIDDGSKKRSRIKEEIKDQDLRSD